MSTLIRSTAILAFARFTNYALLLLSPILLVRILDPQTFGQYREFMVYATLAASLVTFSIPSNLLYFIPRAPEHARQYVSHTNWMIIGTSALGCIVLWLMADVLRARTSFDFLPLLAIYVVLFVNLDFIESYGIAIKRAEYVFYYSTLRMIGRLGAVIVVAWYTRSVDAILKAVIIVEAARLLAVLVVMSRLKLVHFRLDPGMLRNQLRFVVPLGLAASLHFLNQAVGQIAVSSQLGVVALAIYTIGSYQVPILGIVQSAVGDAIFPDMVRQAGDRSGDRLDLWRRSNVAYTFLVVPAFVGLVWYADRLIPLVFSQDYVAAVPLFRLLSLVMLVQCFEFSSPLRAVNRTTTLLAGNVIMLAVNATCIFAVFSLFPDQAILGPAVGIVLGYVVQLTFFGWWITRVYQLRLADLLKWRSLATILACAGVSSLLLVAGDRVALPELVRIPLFAGLFGVCYMAMIRLARLQEVEAVIRAIVGRAWSR